MLGLTQHLFFCRFLLKLNNRLFVFTLKLEETLAGVKAGKECLFVYGATNEDGVAAVQKLEKDTGLKAVALLNNGGAHHIKLKKWYEAFPDMRIWITPTRYVSILLGYAALVLHQARWWH